MLGFGRALGETMALAMLIGNSNQISLSLFSPANTLAALLALNFPEAGERRSQVLMYAALVLLAITLVVNVARRGDHAPCRRGRRADMSAELAGAVAQRSGPLERVAVRATRAPSRLLTLGAWAAAIIARYPAHLRSLHAHRARAAPRLSWEAVHQLPPAGFEMGGGFGNAIVGTW